MQSVEPGADWSRSTLFARTCLSENLGSLRYFQKHVHGDGLICDHCSKRFKSRHGLVLHKQQVAGDYRFQCDICLKKFVSGSHYKGHMNSHTGQRDHQCMKCGKLFGQKSSLNRHLEHCPKVKVDRSKDEHKCLECNKVYSSRDTLASHVQGLHSNTVFRCKFCNKSYKWAPSYHRHMKLHKWPSQSHSVYEACSEIIETTAKLSECTGLG